MTMSRHLPTVASMRSINFAAVASVAAIGMLLVAGCDPNVSQGSVPASPTSAAAAASTGPAASTPVATGTTAATQIPISVESDSQMTANGNNGPSSSILLPTSCQLNGTTVTAEGTYTNGGFVPNLYDRYGDIIVLYVLTAPSPGEPQGIQLGVSDVSESPVLGSSAPWQVSLSFSPSVGVPAQCVVAAQPTHDEQFAP
jgi:hypothetical protein